jgi:hypothetical protein
VLRNPVVDSFKISFCSRRDSNLTFHFPSAHSGDYLF